MSDSDVRDLIETVEKLHALTDRLQKRQDELLALVAKLSQTVPLESEVEEALNQRGALLAEIGTLRAEVQELKDERDDAEEGARRNLVGMAKWKKECDTLQAEVVRLKALAVRALDLAGRWVPGPDIGMPEPHELAELRAEVGK